jgi:hypothetical protein
VPPVTLGTLLVPIALLALPGCGSGEAKPTTTTTTIVAAATSRSPGTVATCLNNRGFLVGATPHRVSGSSPGGVNFAVTFFANPQAARASGAKHHYAKQIISAVTDVGIDDSGNPPAHPGGKPMRLESVDLHTIVVCILHG